MRSKFLTRSFIPSLLLATSGFVACDADKKLETAKAEQNEVARKAALDSAELQRKQMSEAQALANDQRKEVNEERRDVNAVAVEQQKDARELGAEQAKDRADLARENRDDALDARTNVAVAQAGVEKDRNAMTEKPRDRLVKLDARASGIKQRSIAKGASAESDMRNALVGFERERMIAEREVEALRTTAAKDMRVAERSVEVKLDALERTLDRLEKQI
jgi:hypothetical protein